MRFPLEPITGIFHRSSSEWQFAVCRLLVRPRLMLLLPPPQLTVQRAMLLLPPPRTILLHGLLGLIPASLFQCLQLARFTSKSKKSPRSGINMQTRLLQPYCSFINAHTCHIRVWLNAFILQVFICSPADSLIALSAGSSMSVSEQQVQFELFYSASGNVVTYPPLGEGLFSLAVRETKVAILQRFLDHVLHIFGKFDIWTIWMVLVEIIRFLCFRSSVLIIRFLICSSLTFIFVFLHPFYFCRDPS